MNVKAIYKPNQFGHTKISPEELKKAYMTLIGKPVKLNFKEEIGTIIDVQYEKDGDEFEIIMSLPDLHGEYVARGITNMGQAQNVIFTGLSMNYDSSEQTVKEGDI